MSLAPAELPAMTKEMIHEAPAGAIIPHNIESVITIAKTLHQSGLFPDLKNAAQAVAKIMAGAELGLPPIASLNGFHIVQGKIMLHYSVIAMGIRRVGYDYRVVEHTDELCTIHFLNSQGENIGDHTFTVEDAKKSATQNMGKFPKVMLFARCLSQGARFYVPQAFNGMVIYEESERDIIDVPEDPAPETRGTSVAVAERIVDPEAPEEFNPFAGGPDAEQEELL